MGNKAQFVKEYGALLERYAERSNVSTLEYKALGECTEIVTITYKNGYKKNVNVSGDSIIAITHDIYKALL